MKQEIKSRTAPYYDPNSSDFRIQNASSHLQHYLSLEIECTNNQNNEIPEQTETNSNIEINNQPEEILASSSAEIKKEIPSYIYAIIILSVYTNLALLLFISRKRAIKILKQLIEFYL